MAGWRGLGLFWGAVLAVAAGGGVTLQVLGPPGPPPATVARTPRPPVIAPMSPQRAASATIAAPDTALLETAPNEASGAGLPRIGPDGRAPMRVYAASFAPAGSMPRIGLVLAGVGLDAAASQAAIRSLPATVTLAISPYAATPDAVLAAAREAGHEYLLSLPMEPEGYPNNDPGRHALLTGTSPAENGRQLDWALTRFAGYVGVTGALGEMRGERFAAVADQIDPVLARVARRGLLYVDPRPGAARLPYVWSCDVDVVIDDPATPDGIDARLAELEKRAHDSGMAIGLVGAIRPMTIAHLKAWAGNLSGRGAVLVPISALVAQSTVKPPSDGTTE